MTYTPITSGTLNWDVPLNAALTDVDGRTTTNTSNITTNTSSIATHTSQITSLQNMEITGAPDHGYLAWTFPPITAAGATALATAGVLYLSKVYVRNGFTASNVTFDVGAAGGTLTAGQNFVGLYNSSGSRVALTADMTTVFSTANTLNTVAFTAPAALTAGFYWVAALFNGTTGPTLFRGNGTTSRTLNAGLTAATSTAGTILTGQTSLPASFTPSSITPSFPNYWFALS